MLLVEGESRFSIGTKYLMQSTWSHAALYVGAALGDPLKRCVSEADVIEGIRAVGLDEFACLHVRVRRPVGLGPDAIRAVIGHAAQRLGQRCSQANVALPLCLKGELDRSGQSWLPAPGQERPDTTSMKPPSE